MKETIIILLFILLLGGFFTSSVGAMTAISDTMTVSQPATASVHTISFTTAKAIPPNGTILITFPSLKLGDTNSPTTPSKTTFQLNGLANTDVKIIVNGTDASGHATFSASNPSGVGSSPLVSLGLDSATSISSGSDVVIYLGCGATTNGACAGFHPVILNPTKTAATGVADIWSVKVSTLDASNTTLESGLMNVATVETVHVQATVEPFLSFIIQGFPNNTAIDTATTCGVNHAATTTNAGLATTSTLVNLGSLAAGTPNFAAQQMSILSNAVNGYTITATGSGKLTNPASGATIPNAQGDPVGPNSPAPEPLDIKLGGFGIHICDTNNKVDSLMWGQNEQDFANPGPTFPYTLVQSSTPPAANGDNSILLYGVTVSDKTPGGTYKTDITYTATPIF